MLSIPTETTPEFRARIDAMSHVDLAYLWRYARVGDPRLLGANGDYVKERLASLGGITSAISKQITP